MFNKEQLANIAKDQATHVALTARFMSAMGFDQAPKNGAISYGAQYDSLVASSIEQKISKASFMPASLLEIEESLQGKELPNGKGKAFNAILDSIATGVTAHRNRNGGDMPSPALVASALANGALFYKGLDSSKTNGMYDSVGATSKLANEYFLDSVQSGHSAHTAEVPALAMVTIATTIANAMPVVSYLPNPQGTQTVPLVYVRQIARMNYGQTRKDDFLDGVNSAGQYFDSVHRFAMTPDADRKVFTLTTARCVTDLKTLAVDASSGNLPIVAGATTIVVGGIPFANDEQTHASSGATSGELPLLAVSRDGLTIGTSTIKMSTGKVTLGATGEVTITFDTAIPLGTQVIANVVADYEARDANTNAYILSAPNVDAKLDYTSVTAYAIRAIYTATIDALTQMQNELGVDMRSAFIAVVISKLMLEQNCRLLRQARDRAIGQGSVRAVDLTRGSNMTQSFNNTSAIASEIIPALEEQKRRLIAKSTHVPVGFDHYVTGMLSTLMKSLSDDTNFIPTGLTMGMPNSIVRIGSRGTDNFYYVPETAEVLAEVSDSGTTASELLTVARNAEPAKSVFVGHIAVPVLTDDVLANAFEKGVQFYTRQACEMNKNARFGGQVAILKVLNMPASLTSPV